MHFEPTMFGKVFVFCFVNWKSDSLSLKKKKKLMRTLLIKYLLVKK